jgi:hypothetical protein
MVNKNVVYAGLLVVLLAAVLLSNLPQKILMYRTTSHDSSLISDLANGGFKDPSICYRVWDPNVRDRCLHQVGVRVSNPALCKNISSRMERDDCFMSVGIALKNTRLCDLVIDSDVGSYCSALAKKDARFCDQIRQPEYKNTCYAAVAKSKVDPSICDRIIDQGNPKTDYKAKCLAAVGMV